MNDSLTYFLQRFASYKLTPKWWINSAYDLAEYQDAVGSSNQHISLSTTYNSSGKIISGLRASYESNKSREGLEAAAVGISLFRVVNLDVIYGLETVEVDDSSAPRKFGFSFSISESF